MPESMRVAVLHEPGRIEIEQRSRPEPGPGEVLVEVASVGVCGSDTHYFEHGRIGRYEVTAPLVLGHETSGRIVGVGAGVDPARVGERVSLEPGVPCGGCDQCRAGRYNLCPRIVFHATPPVDGTLAELVVHRADFAHPVPDTLSDDAAALLEPLSVALWACRRGGVGAGSRVLVTGAGPIGLLAVQAAYALGAAEVVVRDPVEHRRSAARAYAALDSPTADPDVLLECSGHPGATVDGLAALAPGGTAVLVGMGADELPLPLGVVQERELWVTGVFRYAHTWPGAIALAASGRIDLDGLVTGAFTLEQTAEALTAARRDPHAVKSVVRVGSGAW